MSNNMLKRINGLFTNQEEKKTTEDGVFEEIQPEELLQRALDSDIFINNDNDVKIAKPHEFYDSQYVAEVLLSDRVVILSLDAVDSNVGQRILDFIMGVCYSKNIAIQKYNDNQYLINPAYKLHQRSMNEEVAISVKDDGE